MPEDREGISRHVAVLGLLTIVAYGTWFYGFGVLFDDMRADFQTSDRQLSLAFALAQLLTGLLGLVTGQFLDRLGAREIFLVGATLGSGLFALSATADDAWAFVAIYGIGGGVIGACGFYTVTQTVAARLRPGSERTAIARLTVWGAFSSPLCLPATDLARRSWGWRPTVVVAAAISASMFMAAAALVRRPDGVAVARVGVRSAIASAARNPAARRLAGSACAASAAVSTLLVYQVAVMKALGVAASTAAAIAAARGLAQLLGRLPLTYVLDRTTSRRAVIAARAGVVVAALVLTGAGHWFAAAVYVVVAGASMGALSPLDGIFTRDTLGDTGLGTVMGALALASGLAGAAGPVLAGIAVDITGERPAAALTSACFAVISVFLLARSPQSPFSTPSPPSTPAASTSR